MVRIIAFLILLIPGIFSAIGIKLIRDALFDDYNAFFFNAGFQFVVGLILFIGGLAFIGGFVIHRDRKKAAEKKAQNKYRQQSTMKKDKNFK
ncbi:DUF2627 domain-containing protein [Virgibacillus sp. 179-BFC.A HS]|uniref:DUF2627 domain-containing protein n=1 Tax=Tigheibacillus jepli TaxID=3035914 RepID=A0ABU5CI32_9BACI|nr:DUF2627 domain-containing protein [Virgibacillus sp. 179-BFC.A HS]MDY0405626.1 DUF2627 domain-containing protein [Virgibacillus sp. 179-BFC.A HS]